MIKLDRVYHVEFPCRTGRWLLSVCIVLCSGLAFAHPPSWNVTPSNFQYNANMTAILLLDDIEQTDPSDIIGVFAGEEVRGIASPQYTAGVWRYFLTMYSNVSIGDTLYFHVYIAHLDTVLPIRESVRFVSDTLYGDFTTPVHLHTTSLPAVDSLVVSLQKGWNLISVPLIQKDNSKTAIFPTASSEAFSYLNGYRPIAALTNGEGYWIKFNADSTGQGQTITLSGHNRSCDTIAVLAGWNIIGSLSSPVPAATIVPLGTSIVSSFYRFDTGYLASDTIQPGTGYWIKVTTDGWIILKTSFSSRSPNFESKER